MSTCQNREQVIREGLIISLSSTRNNSRWPRSASTSLRRMQSLTTSLSVTTIKWLKLKIRMQSLEPNLRNCFKFRCLWAKLILQATKRRWFNITWASSKSHSRKWQPRWLRHKKRCKNSGRKSVSSNFTKGALKKPPRSFKLMAKSSPPNNKSLTKETQSLPLWNQKCLTSRLK